MADAWQYSYTDFGEGYGRSPQPVLRAVVAAAGFHGGVVERADGFAVFGDEGEVDAALNGFAAADPELRAVIGAKAGRRFAAGFF